MVSFSKKQKGVILVLLFVIIFLLSAVVVKSYGLLNSGTRTIMIYMAGNNLESEGGLATEDLESIVPSKVDLNHINVLVYTGSTKKWQNDYISNNENAIFILDKSGFKKIKSYDKKSMGEVETFSSFLNYAYDNYKTSKYDLIIWDHGAGALGSISDEFSSDLLYIVEMKEALDNSPFKNKKLETVLFRTCLNATIEVASVYSRYAHYMIASEEVTRGGKGYSVLNFINNIKVSDNGFLYGSKFINSYKEQMAGLDFFGTVDSTYSIINLDNFSNLENSFGNFISSIDVNKNFARISRMRKNIHQYAVESSNCFDYDTIDLYAFINELKDLSPKKADDLLKVIKDTIKFNWSTNDFSNGLSIYFPYNGSSNSREIHNKVYSRLEFGKEYVTFLEKFNKIKDTNVSKFSMNLFSNKFVSDNKKLQLQLSSEQYANYAGARYILFRKNYNEDEKKYKYYPLINSYNVDVSSDGLITANVDNNLVKVIDKGTGESDYITVIDLRDSKEKKYKAGAILTDISGDFKMVNVDIDFIFDDNNKPIISMITNESKDTEVNGAILDLKDWDLFTFLTTGYEILDDKGNYLTDWPKNKVITGWEFKVKDLEFKSSSLDLNGDTEYYGIFEIFDVYGNSSYSNLIKVS